MSRYRVSALKGHNTIIGCLGWKHRFGVISSGDAAGLD